jgi:hypothetical protein
MPTKFDYLSPGIELREIDQSAIAAVPENDGLLLIGRAKKGPAMKPIKITSLANFQSVFGTPMDGVKRGDPWREGNTGGGGWAAYAAEAYLAAGVGPVKFIRLAGIEESEGDAGWSIDQNVFTEHGSTILHKDVEGTLGIFVAKNETITPVDAAFAIVNFVDDGAGTVDLPAHQEQFTVGYDDGNGNIATLTIEFFDSAGGTQTPTGNANEEIDFDSFTNPTTSATEFRDAVSALNATLQTNYNGLSVAAEGSYGLKFTQGEAGLLGNTATVISGINGGFTFDEGATVAFAGGTIVTPTSEGVLAAIVYTSGSNLLLEGTTRDGTSLTAPASATAVIPGSNGWSAKLTNGTSNQDFDFSFNFNTTPGDQNFIRNVLNTDATLFEGGWNNHKMFLGETFEYNVERLGTTDLVAWVAPINKSGLNFTDHRQPYTAAKSGWFIGSAASNYKRLFRFCALDEGSDFHKTHRVVIKNIARGTVTNPDGRFSVEIWRQGDTVPVEPFPNVTLNPSSPRYIGKIIGDLYQEWDPITGKNIVRGTYSNKSDLIRVEMASSGVNNTDIPLGFFGPAKINDLTIEGGDSDRNDSDYEWMWGADTLEGGLSTATVDGLYGVDVLSISWPTHALCTENTYGSNGTNYPTTATMGLAQKSQQGREDLADIGVLKADYDPHLAESAAFTQAAYVFSLEHMVEDQNGLWYFDPSTVGTASSATPFQDLLSAGVKQFAAPFFGGSDGVNIKVDNPFNEVQIEDGYAKYAIESAIEMVADYYTSRYDLIAIPGITNNAIISKLIAQTEGRGDALAIVDLKGIYQDAVDSGTTDATDGSVSLVISEVEGGTASSYAAAYYPNVRIADVSNGNESVLMAPPSVAAIGAIAKSEAVSQPWFAPAGFNRGGLAPLGGTGGANVVGTYEHLSKADRDALYDVNINPIARFPATGDTVIFGQKTLQPEATALDRINVRRMMIYLKKRIGGIADEFLFEQGVKATYDSFKGKIEPILLQVKNEFGITDYKVILDETTTTPDLQDRNIMYAKVYVKPAKAIEYVVIDFVVTQSGVEF